MSSSELGENYVWRVAKTAEKVTRFPLPPSVVTKAGDVYYAVWLLLDKAPDSSPLIIDSEKKRVLHWRTDLKYKYSDYEAATKVPKDIVLRILTRYMQAGAARTEREMAVIAALRKVKMSDEAIEIIFREQPIGDPYRDMGSLIGSLTMADEFVRDIVMHYETAGFVHRKTPTELWFSLTSALRWWYKKRRAQGLRILPQKEMKSLLELQSREIDGQGYILPLTRQNWNRSQWDMLGVDLRMVEELGIINKEEEYVGD